MAKTKKTSKAAQKRFKVTGNKKLLRRPAGQDHFNAKESGNSTRYKRTQEKVENSTSISNMKKIISTK